MVLPAPLSRQTGRRQIRKVVATYTDGSTQTFSGTGSLHCYPTVQKVDMPRRVGVVSKVETKEGSIDILSISMRLHDPVVPAPQEPAGAEEG